MPMQTNMVTQKNVTKRLLHSFAEKGQFAPSSVQIWLFSAPNARFCMFWNFSGKQLENRGQTGRSPSPYLRRFHPAKFFLMHLAGN